MTYLLDFANSAVTDDIKAQDTGDRYKSGALDFNFDPDGTCHGDFETTGTKTILFATGVQNPEPGNIYVDISQVNNYYWHADLSPAFVLKAALKDQSVACSDTSYGAKYRAVSNNYAGFYLNKRRITTHGGPSRLVERGRQESLRRCEANGINYPGKCPGWNP